MLEGAYGLADLERQVPMTLAHRFRVASFTKPVVATALLTLVDQGRVSLEDTLDAHVPGVPNGDRITLRMLAQHTSGLPNYIAVPAVQEAFTAEPSRGWSAQELIDMGLASQSNPRGEPGERFAYSNTGYVLLGRVLERIEGKPLSGVLADRVFEPLGLMGTSYSVDIEMAKPHSEGYQYGDARGPIYWRGKGDRLYRVTDTSPSMWHAAGAMVSTLADVTRMLRAFREGELVSEAAHVEQMRWFDADDRLGVDYAYGLGLAKYQGAIGHSGTTPGYQMTASWWPEEDLTVVILANLYSSNRRKDPATAGFYVVMRHVTGRSWAPPTWPGW